MLTDLIACFAETALALFFFSGFGKPKCKKPAAALITSAVLGVYLLTVALTPPNLILVPLSFALTVILALMFEFRVSVAVLLGVVFSVISTLSELLAAWSAALVSGGTVWTSDYALGADMAAMLSAKALTLIAVTFVRRLKSGMFGELDRRSFALLLLLPAGTLGVALAVGGYSDAASPSLKLLYAFVLLFMIAADVTVFYVFGKQAESAEYSRRERAARLLLERQRQYYDEAFARQNELRRTRHDAKNMYTALLYELDRGNVEQVRDTLSRKLDEAERAVSVSTLPEYAFEAVIYTKFADVKGIKTDYVRRISSIPTQNPVDIAVLIADILDNALENCTDGGKVVITVSSDEDNFCVQCENNSAPVDVKRLETTKKDRENHGFGVASIKKITAEYGGECVFSYENGTFTVSVIIPQSE